MSKKAYNLPQEITDALHTDPVDYIAVWWANNATDEERQAAEERGATPSGAFAFVESVAKKYKKKSAACLPDELTYKLAVIFLRNGSDGDEFVTDAELKAEEAKKAERKAQAEKRKQEAAAKFKSYPQLQEDGNYYPRVLKVRRSWIVEGVAFESVVRDIESGVKVKGVA